MTLRITVLGCGYLGTTHAAGMAELGFEVMGMDVDEDRVATLAAGRAPMYEPHLEPMLRTHVDSGRLRFTTSYEEVAQFGDVHFLCIGTPQKKGEYATDLRYQHGVVDGLSPHLDRPALVVGKSTVPVGTAAALRDRIRTAAPAARDVDLVWNPEFLREGFAVHDTLHPDRIVLGTDSEPAVETMREVYAKTLADGTPLIVTDYQTAELVKAAANAFLATKISFINAMSELCEAAGANVDELADALGHDERIGRKFLNAGIGFGGGCIPKDIRGLIARAGELGVDQAVSFLKEVDAINMRQRAHVVDLARAALGGSLLGTRVAVLGAAFKPDTDDIRDSPALNVAGQLHLQGAEVSVYDPRANDSARRIFPTLTYADSTLEACQGADLVLHLTMWQEFLDADPAEIAEVVNHRRVIDGRNALDADRWRAAGWSYRALGRP
jgi:UDPglucose 6-dehydrogenase